MTTMSIEHPKMGTEYFQEILNCYVELRLSPSGWVGQSGEELRRDEIDGPVQKLRPTLDQKKQAQNIARKLRKIAEDFEKTHDGTTSFDTERGEHVKPDFMRSIVDNIQGAVTPETFRRAIESVITHATSPSIELALACELCIQLGPVLAFVPQVLSDIFNSRVNKEELEMMAQDN